MDLSLLKYEVEKYVPNSCLLRKEYFLFLKNQQLKSDFFLKKYLPLHFIFKKIIKLGDLC